MKKTTLFLISLTMATFFAPTVSASNLVLMTGEETGAYYEFGNVLAREINDGSDTSVTVAASADPMENLQAIADGSADLAFVPSDIMTYAYEGSVLFENEMPQDFSAVASLYMEPVQIVTCNPDIKSIQDLNGKKVSIGTLSSNVRFNAIDILDVYGLSEEHIIPVYESFDDCADGLRDGSLDAAFVTADAPLSAITALSTVEYFRFISLDDDHTEALLEVYPYYSRSTIDADLYGLETDVNTVAVSAVIITCNDTPENDIYNFISSIFENTDTITDAHQKGAMLDPEFAASIFTVPYHAGATKYFEEKDIPFF